MNLKKTLLATALVAVSFTASASTTIMGTSFTAGSSSYVTALNGGTATFSAQYGATDGSGGPFTAATYDFKGSFTGLQGVGIKGQTNGEVDRGEYINATFTNAVGISSINLGLLFDGPEWRDVQEKAQISAIYLDDTVHTFVLTATGSNSASWTGLGYAVNVSPAISGKDAAWSVVNPFGNNFIKSLSLTALTGSCAPGNTCDNQSDFTLISVTAVPEPESYAMLLAGLGLMGTIVRRRNKSKAA